MADELFVQDWTNIGSVDKESWELDSFSSSPMSFEFLRSLEEAKINILDHRYLKIWGKNRSLARVNIFTSATDFSTMDPNLKSSARDTIKRWYPDFMKFNVLECGFFTMIGKGIDVACDLSEKEYCNVINETANYIDTMMRQEESIDFSLIRDIPHDEYERYKSVLQPKGYMPVLGFPNAELNIRWNSIEQYLSELNSKTRLKFKSSLKLKDRFEIETEWVTDYGVITDVLETLWNNVNSQAKDYSREKLSKRFFEKCNAILSGTSEVLVFYYHKKPIAFMFNMIGKHEYIVLDWGVDYSFVHYKKSNLYRVATLLCLERAILLRKEKLELGITNYIPKMTLGADIKPLVYFVKHREKREYTKALVKLMSSNIAQPDSTAHKPFGVNSSLNVSIPDWEERIVKDQDRVAENDLFTKVERYSRADSLRMAGIYGLYPEFKSAQESRVKRADGKSMVLLGTNSYLGIATHPKVIHAAQQAMKLYGTGCSGSPLLNGTLDIHNSLQNELSKFMGSDDTILCSTGYQTNLAGISTLSGPGDLVILDARSHRSLFDACRMSGADYMVYRHDDMNHLEKILKRFPDKRKLVVTDSVFSMEGTIANLKDICALCKKYGARTYVDESHAIGVLGKRGRGVTEMYGLESSVDLVMATFSKSFASIGGFICGKKQVVDYIRHNAGSHIFSASLPPAAIQTVRTALEIVKTEPQRRDSILKKARYMAYNLSRMGYEARYRGSQIVQVVLGNYTLALAAYKKLMERGVYVNPVGPPAVPETSAGFRTSYIATHSFTDLNRALDVFDSLREDFAFKDNARHEHAFSKAS